jgi:hypothetical protein
MNKLQAVDRHKVKSKEQKRDIAEKKTRIKMEETSERRIYV